MPNVESVKWGEDNSIEVAPKLSEEELHAIKQRMEAIDKIFAQEQKAKYKIEVLFGKERRVGVPTPGAMSFWESGAKLNGGGDAKIYICGGKTFGKSECEEFIPDVSNGYGFLVCPSCKEVWKGGQVTGEIFARLTMQGWSQLMFKYYLKLGQNCDLYIKHAKTDLRSRIITEQDKQKGGEELAKVRNSRALYIYPLKNLIKDTANGSDPLTQIYNFLKA